VGDFTMPSLGADMEAGKITKWLVQPGDRVHRGDIVAVVQTDKSDIEVEIFEDGTVEKLVVPEGQRVAVGTVLAHVASVSVAGAPTTPPVEAPAEITRATSPVPVQAPSPSPAVPAEAAGAAHVGPSREVHVESPLVRHLAERLGVDLADVSGSGLAGTVTRADVERAVTGGSSRVETTTARPSSSPYARRVARELEIDLADVSGSGPAGSILESDVRAAVARAKARVAPAEPTAEPTVEATAQDRQRTMQRAIGALMARSKREVPHYYLDTTIDLSAASAWLERTNLERSVADRLVMATLLFCATARAVKRAPEMNGFFVDGDFTPSATVNLGVAISQRSGGLIAPAIHDAEQLSLDEMMARVKDLVRRARNGVLRSSELSDPTITITNLGDLGVDRVFGVIYPPQVALVGFGRVRERPWATDGLLGVRPCVVATLSGDHRVSDGMRGAHFLTEIERLLKEPEKL